MNAKTWTYIPKKHKHVTGIHTFEHYGICFFIISIKCVKLTILLAGLCSYESLIRTDLILMNWGHIMAVQGYVSLQKSIGTQPEHKAALTLVPWDMTVHLRVRVGRHATVRLLFCILACFLFSIQIKQLHLFTLSNIPFQSVSWNIYDTFSWHYLWCLLP